MGWRSLGPERREGKEGGGGDRRGEWGLRWVIYLAVHSDEALFQLMPQIIHLILLQVQISAAVSQNALVAAGSGLDLLQLTAPALQPHHKVSAHVHDSNKRFRPHQCREQIPF